MLKTLQITELPATAYAHTAPTPSGRLPYFLLALLTAAAVAIHGYHAGVEDAEIYLPAARKLLDPSLYPFATEFFLSHGRLSLFSTLLAWSARLTGLSMDWTVFLWYVASMYGMLLACWGFASACFSSSRARWGAVTVVTAVLAMPATNTGLLLMDPYLTARSFSTPLTLIALTQFLRGRYALVLVALLATAGFHPQMAAYLVGLLCIAWCIERRSRSIWLQTTLSLAFTGWPAILRLQPAQEPYREALYSRDYFFLSNWTWYHWLGMIAPLLFLVWFWRGNLRGTTSCFRRVSLVLVPFGVLSILVAAIFNSSHSLDSLARLQPLRCFHLITLVFVLLLAGIVGEYAAYRRAWALAAISLPLACGMYLVSWQTCPDSAHIIWPWIRTSSNAWLNTLLWVRENTPKDALFAVDSRYFKERGVDEQGFRAISERSALADYFKDGGVVSVFPRLAVEWKQMSDATYGLNHFNEADFNRLAAQYPISWVVVHGEAPAALDCPYRQRGYAVCKIAARKYGS